MASSFFPHVYMTRDIIHSNWTQMRPNQSIPNPHSLYPTISTTTLLCVNRSRVKPHSTESPTSCLTAASQLFKCAVISLLWLFMVSFNWDGTSFSMSSMKNIVLKHVINLKVDMGHYVVCYYPINCPRQKSHEYILK